MIAGLQTIDTLQRLARSWLGPVSRDIPRFDPSSIVERLEVPDDVIGTAQRLLDLVRARQANATTALPYHYDLIASLSVAIESAVRNWGAHQAALLQQDTLRAQARQTAAAFEQELVASHRALRHTIGTSHRDYQRLRYPRNAQVAVDDDTPSTEADPVLPRSTNGASTTVPSTGVVRALQPRSLAMPYQTGRWFNADHRPVPFRLRRHVACHPQGAVVEDEVLHVCVEPGKPSAAHLSGLRCKRPMVNTELGRRRMRESSPMLFGVLALLASSGCAGAPPMSLAERETALADLGYKIEQARSAGPNETVLLGPALPTKVLIGMSKLDIVAAFGEPFICDGDDESCHAGQWSYTVDHLSDVGESGARQLWFGGETELILSFNHSKRCFEAHWLRQQ